MRLHNRQIKGAFWTDEEITTWPLPKRLFYLGIIQVADDSGCLDNSPRMIWRMLFPEEMTVKEVEQWINELVTDGKLITYEADGKRCLYVKNFHKHQTITNPSKPETPLPPWITWETFQSNDRTGKYAVSAELLDKFLQSSYTSLTPDLQSSSNLTLTKPKPEPEPSLPATFVAEEENAQPEPTEPITPASEDAIRLCEVLRGLIVRNDPKSPAGKLSAKQSANWITDMDRLIRLDGRDPTEVERVIRWCQADSFWKTNILSAAKLRKQYSQLLLKMQEQLKPQPNGKAKPTQPAKPETPMERSIRLYGIWPPPDDAEDSDTGPPNHKPHYEKPPVPHARASPEERELYGQRLALWRNKQPWYDT